MIQERDIGRLLDAFYAEGPRQAPDWLLDDLQARLAEVETVFAGRESARREAAQKAQQDVLAQLTRLAERARRASEAETITLREGDRLMRDIGLGLDASASGHGNREIEEAAARGR